MSLKAKFQKNIRAIGRKENARAASPKARVAANRRKAQGIKAATGALPDGEHPTVTPCPECPKSGCAFCSLLPWSDDFDTFRDYYERDAEKILAKETDGHAVRHRCIKEEWDEVDILFVGEAPSADEDKQNKAFVGRTGSLLRRCVEEFMPKIPVERMGFTHLVRCRPPRNRDPNKTEIQACSPDLVREINARKPKLIVPLGNKSMDFLIGQTGITTLAGKLTQTVRNDIPETKVLPNLHPAYVLRMDHELDRFCETLEIAQDVLTGDHEEKMGEGEYYVLDKAEDVEEVLHAFIQDDVTVAFDTECGSLQHYETKFPHMLCFSFSNEEGVGYTVPFDHADSPWNHEQCREDIQAKKARKRVLAALQTFFRSPVHKVAQNGKFDRKHIKHAIGVAPSNCADTMLTHLTIDEKRGTHGLKTLAFTYTGMGGYERPLEQYQAKHPECDPDKGGSYANFPGSILFKYAAMDADVTIRTHYGLCDEPAYKENKKFQILADHFFPALSDCLSDMEYDGARIEPEVVAKLDIKYSEEMAHWSEEISSLDVIQEYEAKRLKEEKAKRKSERGKRNVTFSFNPGSPQQLRHVLFDYYGEIPQELTDTGYDKLLHRYNQRKTQRQKKGKGPKVEFAGIVKEAIQNGEWELFSTKADVLHEYERRGNELAPLLLKYREAAQIHGTFIKPLNDMLDNEQCVHGSFWPQGTVTGRLSSSDPNLQNIPSAAKGCYVSRFENGVILQIDYSQIELRIAAAYFNEQKMIEAYRNGVDMHLLTAVDIYNREHGTNWTTSNIKEHVDSKVVKAYRTRCKRVNFGSLYGGGPPALQSTLKKDGVFISIEECKDLLKLFFETRPGLRKGIDNLMANVRKCGYLESFTGRRRRVPEVFSEDEELIARALRQSVNFPIQSGASDMTLMSLVLINRLLRAEGYESIVSLTVHDSIIIDCPEHEALEVAHIAKEIMENLPELSDMVCPGLDWSWLNVPIVAECEAGRSWGSLVEFDPFDVDEGNTEEKPLVWTEEEDGKSFEVCRSPVNPEEFVELMDWKHAKAAA